MIPLDRKEIIKKRSRISLEDRLEKEKAIVETLKPFLKGRIGIYIPIKGEVDIYQHLKNMDVYAPLVISDTEIEFIKCDKNLHKGSFGVLEPEGEYIDPQTLDVIIVPMVAFNGLTRQGYGKGYYDRYLTRTHALKIGVAFDLQEDNRILKKVNDIDMDVVITETRRITTCE